MDHQDSKPKSLYHGTPAPSINGAKTFSARFSPPSLLLSRLVLPETKRKGFFILSKD